MNVCCHDVDGAGDGDDDDDEPEEAGHRPDPFVLPAPAEETPAVKARRLAELGEELGPDAGPFLGLFVIACLRA